MKVRDLKKRGRRARFHPYPLPPHNPFIRKMERRKARFKKELRFMPRVARDHAARLDMAAGLLDAMYV